jgi:phosphoribosylformylglycinamidine synthase subunit PurS
MKFLAEITILPLKGLLDPQGKAVGHSLPGIGISNVSDVRIGKHINLEIDAATEAEARETAEIASRKLLANLIMESYEIKIRSLSTALS